jgi:effector-binding domain-containing protein
VGVLIAVSGRNDRATAPPAALDRTFKGSPMLLRLALRVAAMGVAAILTVALAAPDALWAQTPIAPQNQTTQPGDAFGEATTLPAKTIVYVKGTGSWDKAFATIASSLRKLKTYADKEGLKADGLPITIFTATDDTGFSYEAALPVVEAPKNPPHGDIALGQSPGGQALKFVHRGSYDALDNTYEAITNYLDDKRIEAQDLFIEEYVTDPATADATKLVVNVYVLLKSGQSPG